MRQEKYQRKLEHHLKRCLIDRRYHFAAHLWVVSEQSQLVQFGTLYPAQAKVQDVIDSDRAIGRPSRLVILKSRRHRMSTLMAANIFHACTFNEHQRGYIVAHDKDTVDVLFRMHKVFYENLEESIRPMLRFSNKKELLFENPDAEGRKLNPGLRSSITVRAASSGGKRVGSEQGGAGVGRGDRIDLLHGSEVAFWARGAETFTGFAQAVPDEPGTMIAMESTANGMAGFFYEEWLRATSGDEDAYTPIFIPWFEHPDYRASFIGRNRPEWAPTEDEEAMHEDYKAASLVDDRPAMERLAIKLGLDEEEESLSRRFPVDWDQLKWRRWCIKFKCRGRPETFHVEYPSWAEQAFASSGTPRFRNEKLRTMVDMCVPPTPGRLQADDKEWQWKEGAWDAPNISFRPHPRGWLHIVDTPHKDHQYIIGGDAGHGVGKDATTLAVFDRTERRYVAYMRDDTIKADKLAECMVLAGQFYNGAYLAPEFNGPGILTTHLLVQAGYPRIYYSQRYNTATQKYTNTPGFNTDNRSRNLMIDRFDVAIDTNSLEIPIKAIIEEALTFVLDERKGRADHLPGCHDDLLFAAMIAYFVDTQIAMETVAAEKPKQLEWALTPPIAPDPFEKKQRDELDAHFF